MSIVNNSGARLATPAAAVRQSFLAAMDEFRAEGRGAPGDHSSIGTELRDFGGTWHDDFDGYVAWLVAAAREDTPRPDGWVPSTHLWWLDGDEYLGRIAIRHRLTPPLHEAGGHIGYDVRPSARRKGHATAMLGAALPVARALGLDRVLLTCDPTNLASRKVIEHHGGVRSTDGPGKLRFWIATT